jgi:hypothetical protein
MTPLAESEVFRLSIGVVVVPLVVGLAAGAFAVFSFLRDGVNRAGLIAALVSILAVVFFLPSMATDRIEITSTSFRMRTGLWFSPTIHEFNFQDVTSAEIATTLNPRGRRHQYLRVSLTNGTVDSVPISDLFSTHRARILELLRKRVPMSDSSG